MNNEKRGSAAIIWLGKVKLDHEVSTFRRGNRPSPGGPLLSRAGWTGRVAAISGNLRPGRVSWVIPFAAGPEIVSKCTEFTAVNILNQRLVVREI